MASSNGSSANNGGGWTPWQNKLFENAVAMFDRDTPDRWHNVARAVGGGKTVDDVQRHYDDLVEDVRRIESGRVPLPNYRKPPRHPGSPAGARSAVSESPVAKSHRFRDDAQRPVGSEDSVNWTPKMN
ncbi:unnamed protein product [Linum tenue]|uniref:Myb-like domain-containing protein n=1 Tax=Linum tenue TaxID=586396 RepID=A0AAV0LPS8_9ROSI|nr:unnamed protein product [Linum tenue]